METTAATLVKMQRAINRDRRLADLRDGRKERSTRIPNKRAEASRRACRKGAFD